MRNVKVHNPGDDRQRRIGDRLILLPQGVHEFPEDVASILVHSFGHLGVRFQPVEPVDVAVREAGQVLAERQREVAAQKKAEVPPAPEAPAESSASAPAAKPKRSRRSTRN